MKICRLFLALFLIVCVEFRPQNVVAKSGPIVQDIGRETRNVFAAKCAGCHGADIEKPRGRFGYVVDLKRIASNPEMVIPSRPEESELWVLVERGEMPPSDSPQGSLTSVQKEIVRKWIAAGAPEASPDALDSTSKVRSEFTTAPLTSADRFLRSTGKLHLLVLHFPIALVLAAGVAEVWSVLQSRSIPSDTVRFCLWLGAISAIPTAGLGWIFAAVGNGVGSPQLLMFHRWLGTTAAISLVITAVSVERDAGGGTRSRCTQLLLTFGIVITVLTAHIGGLLAHGGDYFTYE